MVVAIGDAKIRFMVPPSVDKYVGVVTLLKNRKMIFTPKIITGAKIFQIGECHYR